MGRGREGKGGETRSQRGTMSLPAYGGKHGWQLYPCAFVRFTDTLDGRIEQNEARIDERQNSLLRTSPAKQERAAR